MGNMRARWAAAVAAVLVISAGPTLLGTGEASAAASTQTALATNTTRVTYGQTFTFTGHVYNSDGGGTLAFSVDGATIPDCAAKPLTFVNDGLVSGTGATCIAGFNPGNHAVVASYSGDAASSASQSTAVGVIVDPAQTSTTTSIVASPNPSTYGQAVTFTATVSPTDGGGTVGFSSDGTTITGCDRQALSAATATCTASLVGGTHAVVASYTGDARFAASTGSASAVVNPAPTALAATPAVLGLSPIAVYLFTLHATLTSAGRPVGGQVLSFAAGGTTLCGSATTAADGTATCTGFVPLGIVPTVLNLGYTVRFEGSNNYLPSAAHAGLIA